MINPLSHLVLVQTDKTGRVLLETPADLQNLLLLRKTKKQQKVASRRHAVLSAVQLVVTHVKHMHTQLSGKSAFHTFSDWPWPMTLQK